LADLVGKTVGLFPHLGDEKVNQLAAQLGFQGVEGEVACLPKSELQCRNLVARYCLGRRHNHNVRVLPPDISAEHIGKVDVLLCGVVAGLMGVGVEELSEAQRRRILLPMRWGGSMPGAAVASKAQFLNAGVVTRARVREVASGMMAAAGFVPPALRAILEREAEVGAELAVQKTSMERALDDCLEALNEARANPGEFHATVPNSRGGWAARAVLPAAAVGGEEGVEQVCEARRLLDQWPRGGGGEEDLPLHIPQAGEPGAEAGDDSGDGNGEGVGEALPAVSLVVLESHKLSARVLSEAFWRKEVDEVAVGSTHEGLRLLSGACMSGAGLFLSCIPSVRAFQVNSSEFRLAVRRWNGVSPAKTPYTHHCGNCGVRRLSEVDVSHLFNCPCLGGNIRPHDAIVDALAQATWSCGMVSALPKAEVAVVCASGETWYADLKFVVDKTGEVITFDVSVVNTDSATAGRRRGGAGDVEAALVEREAEKWRLPAAREIRNEEGSNTTFVPFVMSSSGGFGPSARGFLKRLYKVAWEEGKWEMASGQREVFATWNTLYASTSWGMRLG
jgi:hypothetical protein